MFNPKDFFGEEALLIFKLGKREAIREGFDSFGVRHMLLGVIESGRGVGAALLGDHTAALRDDTVQEPPEDTGGIALATSAGTQEILQGAIGLALNSGLTQIEAEHLLVTCLAYDDATPPDDAVPRLKAAGVAVEPMIEQIGAELQTSGAGGLVAPEVEQVMVAAQAIDAPEDVALLVAILEHGHDKLTAYGLTPETVAEAAPAEVEATSLQAVVEQAAMAGLSGGSLRITLDGLVAALLAPTPNIEVVLAAHGLDADDLRAAVTSRT